MRAPEMAPVRLTSLARAGGCGCKIASELHEVPAGSRLAAGIHRGDVPLSPAALSRAGQDCRAGGARHIRAGYAARVDVGAQGKSQGVWRCAGPSTKTPESA